MMLKAIFYARFHSERGPSIIHQYPTGSIISPATDAAPLLRWSDIQAYIIPPYDACNQPLSICTNECRVLTFPISIENAKYERNRFTFNICFVLAEGEDARQWNHIARKTAAFLRALEEEDDLLRAEESLPGLKWAGEEGYPAQDVGMLHPLLEGIFADLNRYGEACIQVDTLHTLNLRLSFSKPAPTKVQAWDVPVLIRSLPGSAEWTWDLTLQRIHPHLNDINHVQKISELADVELKLAKRAVKELITHGCAVLLDIFHFQAVYACTPDIMCLVNDENLQDECRTYVAITSSETKSRSDSKQGAQESNIGMPSRQCIINLYTMLEPGLCLADFCAANKAQLVDIDIRRFITYGVMRGFLRRLHKYALAASAPPTHSLGKDRAAKTLPESLPRSNEDVVKEYDRAWRKAALSSGWATPPSGPPLGKSMRSADETRFDEIEKMRAFLNGSHCLDEICVEMHLDEKRVLERMRSGGFGELVILNK